MSDRKFLGIFINPYYVQFEGLQQVFDNIESAGASAMATHPNIARPTGKGKGNRFPPLHVDGYDRLVARPLWDKREIQLESYCAYEQDLCLYENTPYEPRVKPAPSELDKEIPRRMIDEARKRGMEAHIQIAPFFPPGLRAEDEPVYIDGSDGYRRFSNNACLNSPDAEAYALDLVEDTVHNYPDIDGLFMDWVEFGAYRLEDHFTCFCPHCESKAKEQGFDWSIVRRDAMALWNWLHLLTPRELERSHRILHNPSEMLELFVHHPGLLQFLRFKARTVSGFYRQARERMDAMGMEKIKLSARGWPPPWNRSSGMDYRTLAEVCYAVTPKLFTFDYSVLPRWYGQTILEWNPHLSESAVLDALVDWMNLPDDIERRSFVNYNIPAPEELHPARIESYRVRLDEVVAQVDDGASIYPFAHAYLPEPQWKRMVGMIRDSRVDGMWIQMYGYLSDRKLGIIRKLWR
ncbi:hypothetical protein ACFL6S_32725 [Candidatus Poribacteria bacterium]